MKRIILLLLAISLGACTFGALSEYNQNKAKWESAKIVHYRYTLFVSCFCAFRNDMPLSVEVNQGEVVSITRADGTAIQPGDSLYESLSSYLTIDRLFTALKADLEGGADKVAVSYDPASGYPTNIDIDMIKAAVDDELSITVSDFEAVK